MNIPFRAAWWCRNAHCQTLWPNLIRRRVTVALRRERVELPDGDFLDIDWGPNASGPTALILHGLEGSSRSGYARGLVNALSQRGWRAGVMHFRGCSGEPNRLARSYHSGETGDIAFVVERLRAGNPQNFIGVVGFSLGGNVLLKWLGERAATAPIEAAVAVSVPFRLARAAERLNQGFSALYQWKLLWSLRASLARKFRGRKAPIDLTGLTRLRSFWAFDDAVTAPLHGFEGADHYYRTSSSRPFLKQIATPTLIVHALDDPFMSPACVPTAPEISPAVELEVYPHGGHVGFVSGAWPWRAEYWLESRIVAFLQERLTAAAGVPAPPHA